MKRARTALVVWLALLGSTVSQASGRERFAVHEASRAPTAVLYALGDSSVTGVGAREGSYVERIRTHLEDAGKRLRMRNLAVSGATTAEVLHGQLDDVPIGATGLVMVGTGTNDLVAGLEPSAFGKQFEALLQGLRTRTSSPIVVSNIADLSLAPAAMGMPGRAVITARIDAYNQQIAAAARRHGAIVFDLCGFTRRELPRHPEYFSADGFHPSDRGYQAWADGLWQAIARLL